jgi:hypothetical protein
MTTFGIDLEGVITADPYLFKEIISLIEAQGHTAIIVTGRSGLEPWKSQTEAYLKNHGITIPIVYSDGEWKRIAASQAGYEVDIWIDDNPEGITPTE